MFEATSVLRRFSVASDSCALACWLARSALRLQQLLVEVGRLDLGEQLARLHRAPISTFQLFR